ncbi:hypothetical protein O3P69_019369 [Scylla paramamosain]|uniref:Uncharacterized protein n=1 Tax=Scylla paramamosain TaxID=85552 RepID=A0AAW0SWF3_SCYPA
MFKGLVALVSGGASGLGRATVERVARQGGRVVLCDLQSSQGSKVAQEIGSDRVLFVPTDVTSLRGRGGGGGSLQRTIWPPGRGRELCWHWYSGQGLQS